MLEGIDINEIKQYNASLKTQREKAATLKATIDYTTKELEQLCKELSAELGVEVTKDNIQQIYNDEVNKINSTLQSGKAVLAKIANEGNVAPTASTVSVQPTPVAPVIPQANVQNVQAPVTPVAPVVPQAPVVNASIPNDAVAGSVFGNSNEQPVELKPLFSL